MQFYLNQIPSRATFGKGALIDTMHATWDGSYALLETEHGYIQWIFPLFEGAGMNGESVPLSKSGAALIRADAECCRRVIRSYRMMLRFWGFVLADERTGRVERDADPLERLDNLNVSAHNWLRVSRVLKSLGQLGFVRYKKPLLDRLEAEIASGAISNAANSCQNFWAPFVRNEDTPEYARVTREEPADREECCLFQPGGELHGQGR